MAIATSILIGAAVVGAAAAVGSAVEQERDAKRDMDAAKQKQAILNGQLENLKKNRQPVENPYAGLTNQYENLGVAVKSAQFQAEEADIALANTLDTIRQTGGGAAGATALAQAALQSKRGISASLEQQEATNQKLKAQGAQEVNIMKAKGEEFAWLAQEQREVAEIDRTTALYDEQRYLEMAAQQSKDDAQQGYYQAAGDLSSTVLSAGGTFGVK
jgi:chromosome segregation ATPase